MPPKPDVYDDYATQYAGMVAAREERDIATEPMVPELLELVGDIAGLEVLDAGCGEGYLSRILAARGAKVTGVDIAGQLVEVAKAKDYGSQINYLVHDLSKPLPGYEQRFDIIASHFVINDVPDLQGFVWTLASVLKPGGRAVFTSNNPYSFVVRNHIRDYFDSGTAYSYRGMAAEGVKVFFYQRTLQEYLDTFFAAGFTLRRLLDIPTPQFMLDKLTDKLLPQGYQFPFFMILSFSKDE